MKKNCHWVIYKSVIIQNQVDILKIKQSNNRLVKEEVEHAAGVYTFNVAAESDFIALEVEVDKLDVNKLVNVPTSLNELKTKVDHFRCW